MSPARGTPSPLHTPPSMSTQLQNRTLAILATDGFEQSELMQPKADLEAAGATVHVVSLKDGEIKGWDQDDWGQSVAVDKTVSEATVSDYDALVLPGGQINPDLLRADADAVAFVKAFAEAGMPIAAVCHAPWVVIEAGLAEGRDMTSYTSIRTDLKNAGATVHDKEVVVCQNGPFTLITSRKPEDLDAFGKAIIETVASMEAA